MNTFFTSDTHFGHANIIKYCHRPFINVKEMDSVLIARWNSTVRPEDTVYHLGDFSFGPPENYLRRLNGQIRFVSGNHDRGMARVRQEKKWNYKVVWLPDLAEVEVEEQKIVLCHYAMLVWNKSHHGTWHLYGHSHGTLPDNPNSRSIDVGVDVHDFRPIAFDEVAMYMAKKTWKSVDHHGS